MKILRRILLCAVFTLSAQFAFSQDEIDNIIAGSATDANYLATGYVTPALKTIATGLNQGWYNTAKPHKIAGVDLTISVSPVYIPNSDLLYEVDNSKLQRIKLQQTHTGQAVSPSGKGQVPTIFGPDKAPTYQYTDPLLSSFGQTFKGPQGLALKDNLGLQAVPIPIANLGIGLPKNTDLKLRFIPSINLGDQGTLNMFGFGIMHDVKQWIPGIKNLPFDLSGFFGFTKLKLSTQFDKTAHPDQKGEFEVTATTIQGLISKKFSVITFYGGLGYNIGNGKMAVKGNYDLDDNGSYETKNPIAIEAKSSGLRGTAGMRLKLAIFTFHGDYTIQKYKTLTVGFGIAVR